MSINFMNSDPRYAKYKIGRYTYGNPRIEDCWDHPGITLTIGNFCSIARGVTIWLGGNHHHEWITTSPLNYFFRYDKSSHKFDQIQTKGSIVIGNDVWIGAETWILSGVTIGDGSVIGGRSVVAKNIPPYSISVGNPIKIIKKRFDDITIEKLLKIAWWNWSDSKIKENIPLMLNDNIQAFISKHYME